jgi:hypothetical protein
MANIWVQFFRYSKTMLVLDNSGQQYNNIPMDSPQGTAWAYHSATIYPCIHHRTLHEHAIVQQYTHGFTTGHCMSMQYTHGFPWIPMYSPQDTAWAYHSSTIYPWIPNKSLHEHAIYPWIPMDSQ